MSKIDILDLAQRMTFIVTEDSNAIENSIEMSAFRKMYYIMFNAITDAMEKIHDAEIILCRAQQNCEQTFIEATEAFCAFCDKSIE